MQVDVHFSKFSEKSNFEVGFEEKIKEFYLHFSFEGEQD